MVQSQNTNDYVVPTKKTFRWKDQFELANRKPPTFEPDALLHIWTAVVFLISLSNFTDDQLINCNQLVFVNFCPIVCCGRFYRNFSLLSFLFPFCNYFTSCALVNSSFGLLSDWCLMIRPLSLTNHLSRGADDCICKYITICICPHITSSICILQYQNVQLCWWVFFHKYLKTWSLEAWRCPWCLRLTSTFKNY